MLKFGLLIEARERVTAPVRRIRSAIRGMSRDGDRDISRVGRALTRLRAIGIRAGAGLRTALGRAFAGLRAQAHRAMSGIRTILRRGLTGLGLGLGAAAGYGAFRLATDPIRLGSQFEQFQVILENTLGSADAAQRAMAWVQNFAETTPYELDQVMEAFVRLRSYGIDPMDGTLRSVGDAASGMGKDLLDAVEMIADAQNYEFERMKEFGLRGAQAGREVTLFFQRNGREVSRTVRKNGQVVREAIRNILDETFGGMMDRQSRTLLGTWRNLKDQFSKFMLQIANAGLFDAVKARLQRLLERINQMSRDGRLAAWAERISERMTGAFNGIADFIENTDWAKVGRELASIAEAVWSIARAIAAVVNGIRSLASAPSRIREMSANVPAPLRSMLASFPGAGVLGFRHDAMATDILQQSNRLAEQQREANRRRQRWQANPVSLPGLPSSTPVRRQPQASPFTQRRWLSPGAPAGVQMPRRYQIESLMRQRPQPQPRAQADIHVRIQADEGLRPQITRLRSDSPDYRLDVLRGRVRTG